MNDNSPTAPTEQIGVSLVDGDATVRHARQIMLRSQLYDVRSDATCAAMLADPSSPDYRCIIVDIHMPEVDGVGLLRAMRASGWRGKGMLLDGLEPGSELMQAAERRGDKVYERVITDGALVTAIAALIDHEWSGWNA